MFDWNGKQVYPAAAFQPYHVRVEIADLRIRKGAGTKLRLLDREKRTVEVYRKRYFYNRKGKERSRRDKMGSAESIREERGRLDQPGLCKEGIICMLSILYLFGKAFCLLFRDLQK